MNLRMFVVASAVALTTASCGSSPLNFCLESAKAACQVQYKCCTAVERQTLFGGTNAAIGPYADEGGCVAAFSRQCDASSQATDEAIAAGRLAFDGVRADACLTGRRDAANACDADAFFNNDDENCANLVTGLVADGDTCFGTNECAEPASECEGDPEANADGSFTVTLEGKCKGQGDEGEECLPGGRCNGELRCLQDPEGFEQRCEAPRGPNEPCNQDEDCDDALSCRQDENFDLVCTARAGNGEPCDNNEDCEDGLACFQGPDFDFICGVFGGAGTVCSSDDTCQNGLLCGFDGDIGQNICTTSSGAGEPCPSGDSQCGPGLLCLNDFTISESICFAGGAGDPCDTDDFARDCGLGLVCRNDPLQGRTECQPPLGVGQDCERFAEVNECDSDLRCRDDGTFTFKCLAPIAPAALCSFDGNEDPCDENNACLFDGVSGDNICQPRAGGGDPCFQDEDCGGALFCDTINTDTCIGRRNANQSCDDDRECSPGLECRTNDAGAAFICRALSSEGQGCAELDDCVGGLDCRFDDAGLRQICRGLSVEDSRCDQQSDCASGLDCRANDVGIQVCLGLSAETESCVNVLDCEDGLTCRVDDDFQLACLGPSLEGDICSIDGDCGVGLVCRFDNVDSRSECLALGDEGDACFGGDDDCLAGLRCRTVDDSGEFICTQRKDDFEPCAEDAECISGFCDLEELFCTDEPPEVDFEICDGI